MAPSNAHLSLYSYPLFETVRSVLGSFVKKTTTVMTFMTLMMKTRGGGAHTMETPLSSSRVISIATFLFLMHTELLWCI